MYEGMERGGMERGHVKPIADPYPMGRGMERISPGTLFRSDFARYQDGKDRTDAG